MIVSIITVNYNTEEWIRLLLDSVKKYTSVSYEIIITDNSNSLPESDEYKRLSGCTPPRHWLGITKAIKEAKGAYILLLDADSHIMRHDWDKDAIELFNEEEKIKLIACKYRDDIKKLTVQEKKEDYIGVHVSAGYTTYYRPFAMFFKKDFLVDNKLSFKPYSPDDSQILKKEFKTELYNVYFDVGVYVALKIIDLGFKVEPMYVTREGYKSRYENLWGTVWELNGKPTFYHHGYSSRFFNREEFGKRKKTNFLKAKKDIFNEFYKISP